MHSNYLRSVWISYSGKNSEFVKQLTRDVNEKYSNVKPEASEYVPFRLMTYLRYPDTSEPIKTSENSEEVDTEEGLFFHLGISDNILDLVESIALNLRRVIVISEDYLKSNYCLLEFCACLCAPKSLPIFFIYLDSLTFDTLIEYKFPSGEQGIVEKLINIYSSEHYQFLPPELKLLGDDSKYINDYFEQVITSLSNQLYIKVGDDMLDLNRMQEVITSLQKYVKDQLPDSTIKDLYYAFFLKLFDEWKVKEFSKKCLDLVKGSNEEYFITQNFEKLIVLAKVIKKELDDTSNLTDNDNIKRSVYDYCGILALRLIDPVWAMEVKMSSLNGARFRLSENPDDPISNPIYSYSLATHAISQESFVIDYNSESKSYPKLKGHLDIDNIVQAREHDADTVGDCVLNIMCHAYECDRKGAEILLKDRKWAPKLRARLRNLFDTEKGSLSGIRFYIGRGDSGTLQADKWLKAIDLVLRKINQDAGPYGVKIGVVILNTRDDGNVVQFIEDDPAYDLLENIRSLMEKFNV